MAHFPKRPFDLFETQHGVASPSQLIERGVNACSIKRLERSARSNSSYKARTACVARASTSSAVVSPSVRLIPDT